MDNCLISIIVPVYNVSKYLEKCVQSLIVQEYKNIEIILVDDGSTDGSGELCDVLAKEDERIKVIHKQNGGLSSARNAGIKFCSGDYIGFVDSDDYIEPQMYSKLMCALKKNNADMVLCGFKCVDENGEVLEKIDGVRTELLSQEDMFDRIDTKNQKYWCYVIAWNKLYSRAIFDNVLFPEGRIHEDEFIIHHIISNCNLIVSLEDELYYYVQRKGSITATTFNAKRLDEVDAFLDRYFFYKNRKCNKRAKTVLRALYNILYNFYADKNAQEYRSLINEKSIVIIKYLLAEKDLRAVKLWIKMKTN